MKTNLELKIAAVVGFLMIMICLIVISIQNSKKDQVIDLTVYKHYINKDTNEGYYGECRITTEELTLISRELTKVDKLGEDVLIPGGRIEGNYKIVFNKKIYAFDDGEAKRIFRDSDNTLHEFDSKIYEIVLDRCDN